MGMSLNIKGRLNYKGESAKIKGLSYNVEGLTGKGGSNIKGAAQI